MNTLRRLVPVYLLYLAAACAVTFPLITQLSTHLPGHVTGDSYEYGRHVWWFAYALGQGQSPFQQTLLAYPDGLPSWYLWGTPLRVFPAWLFALALPLPAAYNLTLLLRLALNGLAMYAVVRHWTKEQGPALAAGMIFLAYPAMQGHLWGGHPDLLALWALPPYAWALSKLHLYQAAVKLPPGALERDPRRLTLLAALLFLLSLLGNFVLLIYAVAPLTLAFALHHLRYRHWAALRRLVTACALGGAAALVFVLPAALELLGQPGLRDAGGSVAYSADLFAIVAPSFFHPLWRVLGYNGQVLGTNLIEGMGYVGVIGGGLALLGAFKVIERRLWVWLALAAWLLSLGPLLNVLGAPLSVTTGDGYRTFVPLPYALLQHVPVLNVARTPGRFNLLVGMCVAVLAGYALAWLNQELYARTHRLPPARRARLARLLRAGVAGLLALILLDYQSFWGLPTLPADVPAPIAALRQRGDLRAVFSVPAGNLLAAKEALWLQTAHHLPLVAGQVTRASPVSPAKLALLEATLDPALLRAAGADVVIVQRAFDPDGTLFQRAQAALGAPTYADARFGLFAVPDVPSDAPPRVLLDGTFDNQGDGYVYAPSAGWVRLDVRVPPGRALDVATDAGAFRLADGAQVVPLGAPGYHTLRFSTAPVCPAGYAAPLLCPAFTVSAAADAFVPGTFDAPIVFARGVTLRGAAVLREGDGTRVLLWWRFAEGIGAADVRFIKMLDAQGTPVAGVDAGIGAFAAGAQHVETLLLPGDLPPGDYAVYAGWYPYPDLTRFPVLSGGDARAQDGLAWVGALRAADGRAP